MWLRTHTLSDIQGRITLKKDLLTTRLEEVAMLVRQAGEHLTESLQPYVRYATRHDPSDESWPTLTSLNLSRPANIQRINDTVAYFGNPEVPHRTHHTAQL
jgi:hypothetical protein